MQKHRTRVGVVALLALALAALGLAGSAQAKLVGNYTKFAQCPYLNTEVKKCIYSMTGIRGSGARQKGSADNKAVILQGGYGAIQEDKLL